MDDGSKAGLKVVRIAERLHIYITRESPIPLYQAGRFISILKDRSLATARNERLRMIGREGTPKCLVREGHVHLDRFDRELEHGGDLRRAPVVLPAE